RGAQLGMVYRHRHAVNDHLGVARVGGVVMVVQRYAGRLEVGARRGTDGRVTAADLEPVVSAPQRQRLHADAPHAHEVEAGVLRPHLRERRGRGERLGLLSGHGCSKTADKIRRAAPTGVRAAAAREAASRTPASRSERHAASRPSPISFSSTTIPAPAACTASALCSWWSSALVGSGTITAGTPWNAASDSVPTPARVMARSAADQARAASRNSCTW